MTTPTLLVRSEIERFLRGPEPEVLCISGAWGTGKTYLWKEVLVETAKAQPPPSLLSYSYVSLFGVDRLEELKLSIFANRISLEEGKIAKYSQWSLAQAKKAQPLLEQIPRVGGMFKTLGGMYFSSVRGMIVCIDDLERRSKILEIKDVLGLISYLKEERKCKVVLLLNDGELGVGVDDFRNHFEKTIDVHVRFAPTALESSTIAFPKPDALGESVKTHCVALGIKNIRIIRKIERAARDLQSHIQDFDPEIHDLAVRSIVLLGWSLLKGAGAPSIEYLKKRTGLTTFSFDKNKALSHEEAQWNSLLDNFNWGSLDELDHALIASLEIGYFDPDKIRSAAGEVWKRLAHQRQDGDFEQAWSGYHDSFDDNQDEVLDGLFAAFKQTYKTITFMNLDGTVRLFRELGRNGQAEELLKFYTDNRSEPQKFWDLDGYAFGGDLKDPGVVAAIREKFKSFGNAEVNMAELLEAMGSTGKGWNMAHVDAVAALPTSEYKKLFKAERGRKLRRIVSGGLLAKRSANPTGGMNSVAKSTVAALREIAAESAINARRVANFYGISSNTEEPQAQPPANVDGAEDATGDVGGAGVGAAAVEVEAVAAVAAVGDS
jgi:hypothetical protein